MPISPIVGGSASGPAQSQRTDILLSTLIYKKVRYGFACLRHVLHKMRPADGKIGIVLHGLAYFGIGTANGDVFKRTAKTSGSVAFKMRQHYHAVIIHKAFAYGHFRKMLAAPYRQLRQWCRF